MSLKQEIKPKIDITVKFMYRSIYSPIYTSFDASATKQNKNYVNQDVYKGKFASVCSLGTKLHF